MSSAGSTVSADEQAIRDVAGACYLALISEDPAFLLPEPSDRVLEQSGLAGIYANLCVRHGVAISRRKVIFGLQLSSVNAFRWLELRKLMSAAASGGIDPVLFKGGAMHARWPQMRELRALADYDLIVPLAQLEDFRSLAGRRDFTVPPNGSWLTRRLSKGAMVWKGNALSYQNLDIHAHVTEPPVCSSLTRSILRTTERIDGVRIPDTLDCVCMIALHVVRSGMYRPLQEYLDLLWYVDRMDDAEWEMLLKRARQHQLLPALFLSLRQAIFCVAIEELAPERAASLSQRVVQVATSVGRVRKWLIDWLAPEDYPLHPIESRNHPGFRRSLILGAGTSSLWRVIAAFLAYGTARLVDGFFRTENTTMDS
jgi:hypothetical protein